MEQTTQDQIDMIVSKDAWTVEDCTELLTLLSSGASAAQRFMGIIGEMETENPKPKGAMALKIGIGLYMLGSFTEAIDILSNGTDNKDRHYAQAMCCKNLYLYEKAVEEFTKAQGLGWDALPATTEIIECQALGGNLKATEKGLKKLNGETADALYLRGLINDLKGLEDEACDSYEQARAIDPNHVGATFRLAYYYDLHGEDDQAIELYLQCVSRPPVHANALLNLAILYEDAGHYSDAELCLRRILISNPNHTRARLFMKDVNASKTMYFDEDQAKRVAKRNAVLDIPVTDFELSVRARNCLKKMNIRSLGDLVITTETQLLAYKNFGETSLREIKEMLTAKGLHLGQGLEDDTAALQATSDVQAKAENESVLATPLERVEFSIRARKALEDLKVSTLGELSKKSEAELLACKNFGQSSLNEIRQRLAEYGLRLREL